MAYSLLDAVNMAMKRVKLIGGDNAGLTSLTDSGRQTDIDVMVQCWNEQLAELWSMMGEPYPLTYSEFEVALSSGVREYPLPNDFERMRWPGIDQTNGTYVFEWPEGYKNMRLIQIVPTAWKGRPVYAAINPLNTLLRFGWIPQDADAGITFNFPYDARRRLAKANDLFPCSDGAVDALLGAVVEWWKKSQKGPESFDRDVYAQSIGRAGRLVMRRAPRRHY